MLCIQTTTKHNTYKSKITVKLSYLWQTTVTFTTEPQPIYTIQRNHNKIIIALLILLATIIELIFNFVEILSVERDFV